MKRIILVAAIIVLGLILRLHNYSIYPQRGATSDEYTYTFLGLSLLTKHYPESWSNFPQYPSSVRYDLSIRGIYFPMVHPYFDHPPLNGLLVAAWSLIRGENTYVKVDLRTIRLVPIALSVISSLLLFAIAKRMYDYKTAVWALLIYSTVTIFVMNTRVVFAENLLTPLFLFALYLYDKFSKKLTMKLAIFLGVLSGLSVLAKELGIVVFVTLLFFFVTEKIKWKKILIFTISSFFVAFLYVVYGFYFDKNLFLSVVLHQSSRQIGPEVLQMLTQVPIIVNKVYYDGWYFLGWLALFFGLYDIGKNKRIIVPALMYVLLLFISLTKEGEMGWYVIPLYPFMAIAAAHMLKDSIEKYGWSIFVLITFVGIPQIKLLYENNFGMTTTIFRIFISILFGPLLLALFFRRERLFAKLSSLWFYFSILANIFLTYNYVHPA